MCRFAIYENTADAFPMCKSVQLEFKSNWPVQFIYTDNLVYRLWLQKEEIKSCEERVKKLLEMTPPKGKEFLNSIEHILERERNWVWFFGLSTAYNHLCLYEYRFMLTLFPRWTVLGVVETWWVPTIWKAANREEINSGWGEKAVWMFLCWSWIVF